MGKWFTFVLVFIGVGAIFGGCAVNKVRDWMEPTKTPVSDYVPEPEFRNWKGPFDPSLEDRLARQKDGFGGTGGIAGGFGGMDADDLARSYAPPDWRWDYSRSTEKSGWSVPMLVGAGLSAGGFAAWVHRDAIRTLLHKSTAT